MEQPNPVLLSARWLPASLSWRNSWGVVVANFTPTFSLTCVMSRVCEHSESKTFSEVASVPPSVCQMYYSTQLCAFLAPGRFIRKQGGGRRPHRGSEDRGRDCFMFPNLLDYSKATSNKWSTCFQTALLVQSLHRWKDQKVFYQREIAARSKMWRCLNDGTERFSFSECSEGLWDAEFSLK